MEKKQLVQQFICQMDIFNNKDDETLFWFYRHTFQREIWQSERPFRYDQYKDNAEVFEVYLDQKRENKILAINHHNKYC